MIYFELDETDSGQKQVLYEEGAGSRGLNLYVDNDRLYVGGWNTPSKESGWSGTWLSTDKISANKWHHVTLVLDGGRSVSDDALRGYLDGQAFGSGEGSMLWSHGRGIGLGSINRGTRFHDGAARGSYGLAGALDEVMILNSALDDSQVRSLAAA
ncbi:MAG: LamG domain-containing protein [Leptolyngbya sp. SIO4C1]|nr:LamG domain-containing protein [Leptolyngbya sp. SIO4C1]